MWLKLKLYGMPPSGLDLQIFAPDLFNRGVWFNEAYLFHTKEWINQHPAIQGLIKLWQTLGNEGAWQQDALILCICLVVSVMLFLIGTVFALFVQSIWGIFTSNAQGSENTSDD